jgi:protease-4
MQHNAWCYSPPVLGALFRLLFLDLLGNLVLLLLDLPRWLRRRPRWVELTLKEPLPERPPRGGRLFGRRPSPSIEGLCRALEDLGKDPRLAGVVVRIESLDGGWARLQAVRGALLRFREGGKRLVAHLSSPGLREVVAASAADTVLVDESGPLGLHGLKAEVTYFTGALAKAGVTAEAEARGPYKTFAEPFVREEMSPELRETLDRLLDGFHGEAVAALAAGRKVTPARAAELLEGGPWMPADAEKAGLVDGVCYRDEIEGRLGDQVKLASLAAWRGSRLRFPRWWPLRRRRRVRVISLHGGIVGGEGMDGPRRLLGAEAARRTLEAARKDRGVASVVLHVDSRGGGAAASDLIWREVVRLAREKPVVACFGDVAASGGYYLACGATRIVAQPTTVTGSIGVVSAKPSLAGAYRKLGLKTEILARGEAAAMDTLSRGWSTEERRRMAAELDALYAQFVRKVAEGRRLEPAAAEAVARGRVWTGADAHARGLVDELGDAQTAIARARELARKREGERLEVEDAHPVPRRRGLLSRLLAAELPEPLGEIVETSAFARERLLFLAPFGGGVCD